jgi:hypothetical protein
LVRQNFKDYFKWINEKLYEQSSLYMAESKAPHKKHKNNTSIWKAKRNIKKESRWIKWYNLSHKDEDMDKVEEDNLEHNQSNIQRQRKL